MIDVAHLARKRRYATLGEGNTLPLIVFGAGVGFSQVATLQDLTTVFVPYLAALHGSNPTHDHNANVENDLVNILADYYNLDRNTLYDVVLSSGE